MVDRGFVDYVFFILLGGLGLFNVVSAIKLYKLYGEMYEKYEAAEKELAKCRITIKKRSNM